LLLQTVSDRWAVGAFAASIGVAAIMCIALPWLREADATAVAATERAKAEPGAA